MAPVETAPPGGDKKISRDDIEAKLRELQGEVDETAESAKGIAVAVGAAVAVGVVVVVFLLGRKRGKSKTTIVEVRRFRNSAAGDIGPPIVRMSATHGENMVAKHKETQVITVVWQERLLVDDRSQLDQCLERPPGDSLVRDPHDSTALTSVERFNDDVTAQLAKAMHCFVEGLADNRGWHAQSCLLQQSAGQVFVDCDFDRARWVDHKNATGLQPGECIHAEDHLLE